MDADWSSLLPELLEKIVIQALASNTDYVRFRAVCKNWRSALPKRPSQPLACQIPWLMLPSLCNNDHHDHYSEEKHGGDFFSLSDNKVYHIDLPEVPGGELRCIGSSHGWLCFVERKTLSISIWNPLTKDHIQFPSITTIPQLSSRISEITGKIYFWSIRPDEVHGYAYNEAGMEASFFQKFILSDNPSTSNNNYIAMLILGARYKVAFCRPGDNKWLTLIVDRDDFIDDAIYHKGQFYGVHRNGKVTVYNTDPYNPNKKTIAGVYPDSLKKNLVEVSGELMLVVRDGQYCSWGRGIFKTKRFCILKFIPTTEKWIRVKSLDDRTLFLGMNCSFSLSAKNGLLRGCKPNSIYFTDERTMIRTCLEIGGHDGGIYNLKDGSIEPLPCCEEGDFWIWPPPIWITPSLS